jgi:acyl-CoA thioesterase FadM
MTTTISPQPTVLYRRPSYEGANIRTWIGFKHFMYLVEDACLQWLRDHGTSTRELYLEHGLGVEIVDCSVQLPAVLELDDEVRAEVSSRPDDRLAVRLSVVRDGRDVTVLRGTVRLALVHESGVGTSRRAPAPLARLEVATLTQAAGPTDLPPLRLRPDEPVARILARAPGAFVWSWRAPYYYCHFSDRVQHSGFVRALEEVVDRFLDDRGLSVAYLLATRSWIPVVSRARVRMLAAAHMEETVHTVFTVLDVPRGMLFDGRMDCYVRRGDELRPVATARILHGYAVAAGDSAGALAELDDGVVRALRGERE